MTFSNIVRCALGASLVLLLATWGFRGNAVEGSTNQMATKQIIVQRFSVTSSKSFQEVASRLIPAGGVPANRITSPCH
jgi:hypothetical protein